MKEQLKRFAWFIIKSPQRKMVGYKTLIVDFIGLVNIIKNLFFNNHNKETIWICTGNYNRSESLIKYLVGSMPKLANKHRFGLSIVDCESTDMANIEDQIKQIWSGPLVFSTFKGAFSRAKVFNQAIEQAPGSYIFVCDADIELPTNLQKQINRFVTNKSTWFPICQWQIDQKSSDWKWFTAGTGIFAATKNQLALTGTYNTMYTTWGAEDWDLFFRQYHAHIMPVRTRCVGLYHHWHTPTQPKDFEKMF